MLSICIPVYNFNVTTLVNDLCTQINKSKLSIEIILIDDNSTNEDIKLKNKIFVNELDFKINYIELKSNIGRAAIRNKMGRIAKNDYLLFIDSDSQIPDNFILNYCNSIPSHVVIGGTQYKNEYNKQTYLRWVYGMKREKKNVQERSKNPYSSFTANNFLIKKNIFLSIQFNESITAYGHEDTYFGYEIKKLKIPITHIDNAVYHIGLENAETFILKTLDAVKNLYLLYNNHKDEQVFVQDNKLLYTLEQFNSTPIKKPISWFLSALKPIFYKNLISSYPILFFLDLYKLAYILELDKEKAKP